MPLRDDLLNPIPGDNPSGKNLRYDPIYDKIKEARREDDDSIPVGEWATQLKKADWPQVIKLCSDALATKSKDLQIAAWLTEAMLKREGFTGLRDCLQMQRSMVETFWDTLYPEIEDGDLELRAAPLDWVGGRLEKNLKLVPLTKNGLDFFKYKESRTVGYEADAEGNEQKSQARATAIEEGKLTGEQFDDGFNSTPKSFYKEKMELLESCTEAAEALGELCDSKFSDAAPSFGPLKDYLEEVRGAVRVLLQKKLEQEPDEPAPEEAATEAAAEEAAESVGGGAAAARARIPGAALAAEPVDHDDAISRIASAARFLRQENAESPVPYLLLRALRWGELRAAADSIDPALLDAPRTEDRKQIKTYSLEAQWPELLEAAEKVMATPAGRGWLDLHRHVVKAFESMGTGAPIVAALRSELRTLLSDYPTLPTMSMNDDSPTANPETQEWLKEFAAPKREAAPVADVVMDDTAAATSDNGSAPSAPPDIFAQARTAVEGGNLEQAIDLLSEGALKERSGRARFQRRMQLAQICLEAGYEAVALPNCRTGRRRR